MARIRLFTNIIQKPLYVVVQYVVIAKYIGSVYNMYRRRIGKAPFIIT